MVGATKVASYFSMNKRSGQINLQINRALPSTIVCLRHKLLINLSSQISSSPCTKREWRSHKRWSLLFTQQLKWNKLSMAVCLTIWMPSTQLPPHSSSLHHTMFVLQLSPPISVQISLKVKQSQKKSKRNQVQTADTRKRQWRFWQTVPTHKP